MEPMAHLQTSGRIRLTPFTGSDWVMRMGILMQRKRKREMMKMLVMRMEEVMIR